MKRRIPSTAALVAFDASARHESFTRAAEELALTQSAVCRQVAGLEGMLGVKLFRRTRRGVKLTDEGRSYAGRIGERLDALERDTLELMAGASGLPVIDLAVVPTFGTRWLLPRLPQFMPGAVQINLHTRTRPFLFDDTHFDAAIYAGDGHWPGCITRKVLAERLIAVCSPALLFPQDTPITLDRLSHLPLLQQTTRPHAWRRWFEAAGLACEGDLRGPRYEQFSMSVQAAVLGLGVALVPDFLVADELAQGRLCQAVPQAHDSDRAYYFVVPEGREHEPLLVRFGRWLADSAADPTL
ncbi:LysR substrate-binding domain-containing protein [Sphaerotilus sp.]|uniref:LysR substrate-binding domain-containing protein n=1 Tax=Sphaerotilus sp. TaxID=2093942 RepID=UPI002ACD5366|nr:LysR substrate-binding domain-containing protein [Sphaerotilus sp.]MDZ7858092.1 LysR substrate-binding domain-containing protein [Sphaerotilus sp.]